MITFTCITSIFTHSWGWTWCIMPSFSSINFYVYWASDNYSCCRITSSTWYVWITCSSTWTSDCLPIISLTWPVYLIIFCYQVSSCSFYHPSKNTRSRIFDKISYFNSLYIITTFWLYTWVTYTHTFTLS